MDRDLERAIEWDCFHLQNKYYVLVDAGDYEGGGNLFTEDAIWTYGDRNCTAAQKSLRDLKTA